MTVLVGVRLAGRRIVVAGGGRVAAAKCAALLSDGAAVEVIAPDLGVELTARVEAGEVAWTPRPFRAADLEGAWVVIAATGNAAVDREVCAQATARQILSVCTSGAAFGTAVTPATTRHHGLLVGIVSTGAANPRRVRAVRDLISGTLASGVMPLEGHRLRRVFGRTDPEAVAS